MKALTPYPTLAGEVSFKVASAGVDGRALPLELISVPDRMVALHQVERREWREARLEIRAELPDQELGSGAWTDAVCVAVLTESATNSRAVRPLRRTEEGWWQGTVALSEGTFRSRADLSVAVVAEVDGVPGRVIAASEENWVVDVAARAPVRQQELKINELDFRDGEVEWLRPYKDAPWMVETSGDLPTVYLNTGFEGVKELLSPGGSAIKKSVRDLLAAQIAVDAWTAMFHSAVGELESDDDGRPVWPSGWQGWVLRGLLPDILPELSLTDALAEVHERRSVGSGWEALQSRIQYAISRRSRIPRSLGTALRALDRSATGSPS